MGGGLRDQGGRRRHPLAGLHLGRGAPEGHCGLRKRPSGGVLLCPPPKDLPTEMPRGTPPPPPGTFLLSRVLLAAEAAAGEPSPAWERSGLRRGRLGVGRSAGVRSPAPRDGRIGGPTWKGQGPRGSRTMRHVATRAILRPVSRALRPARGQLRGGSGIEWALLARGAASQAFLSPVAAVAPALQNHLRGEGYCGSLGQGEASRGRLLGGGAMGSQAGAPGRGGRGTRGPSAGLLPAPGAARPPPASTRGPGSGTCGQPAGECGRSQPLRQRSGGVPSPHPDVWGAAAAPRLTSARRGAAAPGLR